MGSLADKKCVQGQRVSGILVKKNFNYHILNPSDLSSKWFFFFPLSPKLSPEILVLLLQGTSEYNSLPTQLCALLPPLLISDKQARHREVTRWFCFAAYTELAMSTVKQSQAIPFTGPYSLLVCHLRNLTGKTYLRMCTE